MKRPFVIGLLVACITVLVDQISKYGFFALIDRHGGAIEVLPFFNLVHVYNTGVSFGIGNDIDNSHLYFSLLALSIVGILGYWLWNESKTLGAVALGLVIGGAIGNVIDRLLIGAVMDFLDFHAFGYHWPAFNVADSTIFIGVVLLLFCPEKEKQEK